MRSAPRLIVSEPALRAFRDAAREVEGDEVLRLKIDPRFQNDLYFGEPEPLDVVITVDGLTIAMDARTAARADGLEIDYVDGGATGPGFKLNNPNESSPIKGIRPADVVALLQRPERLHLVDVRPAHEHARARVDAARRLDEGYQAELDRLPRATKLVFLAHHTRGARPVAERYVARSFSDVWVVVGGIDAWSTMAPEIPRY